VTTLRTVAVTGGSGQLGTLVVRRLLADPQVGRVISIDRRLPIIASPKLVTAICDVRDLELSRHLEGVDAVIHCAFVIIGGERTAAYRAINVAGSENVFRAAAAAGVSTMVFVSSITAYGCVAGHPVPIVETTPRRRQAEFAYACCKFDVEAFLDQVEPQHPEMAISRIRANILIGRKMPHFLGLVLRIGWIPDLDGVPLPIVWDEDVADLLVLALNRRAHGAFNAAAEDLLPSAELAERTGMVSVRVSRILLPIYQALYALLSRMNAHVLPDPSWATRTAVPMIASSDRARRELAWSPRQATAVAVIERFRAIAPWRLDLTLLFALWMLSKITRAAQGDLGSGSTRYFLCLNGSVAGDFSLLVDQGSISIRAGAPTSASSTATMTDELFRDLVSGRAAIEAAFESGLIDWFGPAGEQDLLRKVLLILGGRSPALRGWRRSVARLIVRLC